MDCHFKLLSLIVLSLFVSCEHEEKYACISDFSTYGEKSIELDTLIVSRIDLDTRQFSGDGFIRQYEDKLLLFDRYFCTVEIFDLEGNFISTHLGKGNGPFQIPHFDYYVRHEDQHIFVGSDMDINIVDRDWSRTVPRTIMEFAFFRKPSNFYDPTDKNFYYFDYNGSHHAVNYQPIQVNSKEELVVPIDICEPDFCRKSQEEVHLKNYYGSARILASLDLYTGKVNNLFGCRPEIYQRYPRVPYFNFYNYLLLDNALLVNFAIDSMIYVYDQHQEPLLKFGQSYQHGSFDCLLNYNGKHTKEDRINSFRECNFFSGIYVDEEREIVFRSYHIGSLKTHAGLQIYRGHDLIADVLVPSQVLDEYDPGNPFYVIGRHGDKYYADGYFVNKLAETKAGVYVFEL